MTGDKFRFRFTKSGTLRLVSHHDLMRCAERMLRRAAVPFKSTAGFHPTPRLVFALSLPLGVVGRDEVVELELTEPRDGAELLATLNAQAPAGLTFTRVAAVPMKSTARVRRAVYELPLPPERAEPVRAAAVALLAEPKVWVERLRPSAKRLNIRPFVRGLRVEGGSGDESAGRPTPRLVLDLWVTQDGTARAEELLRALGCADLLDAGAVLERAAIEIRDETTVTDPGDAPPDGPTDSVPLSGAETAALTARLAADENEQPAEAGWGVSPNGPVVE
jgi:radical SAM-linked protein